MMERDFPPLCLLRQIPSPTRGEVGTNLPPCGGDACEAGRGGKSVRIMANVYETAPAPFDDHTFSAPDGLRLHARIYTPAKKSHGDVLCLPGLTRNCRDFHDLALHLAQTADRPKRVIALDARGRGLSEYDTDWQNYNVVTEAGDVLAMLAALGIESADFIGTSRGGILIHLLAAMEPTVLKRIVLNDIGPVIEGEGLMRIKAALERAPKPKDWDDAVKIQRDLHGREFPALTLRDWDVHARAIYREIKPGKIAPILIPSF